MRSIAPMLWVSNGAQAVEFYQEAFGASEVYGAEDPNGATVAQLFVDGAGFCLGGESPEHGNFSPGPLGDGSARLIPTVPDPDALFARTITVDAREVVPSGEAHGRHGSSPLDDCAAAQRAGTRNHSSTGVVVKDFRSAILAV
jgi:PhnB protein